MEPCDQTLAILAAHQIEVQKSGRNFIGLCPFHNSQQRHRTPSFVIFPDGAARCFGSCPAGQNYWSNALYLELMFRYGFQQPYSPEMRQAVLHDLQQFSFGNVATVINTRIEESPVWTDRQQQLLADLLQIAHTAFLHEPVAQSYWQERRLPTNLQKYAGYIPLSRFRQNPFWERLALADPSDVEAIGWLSQSGRQLLTGRLILWLPNANGLPELYLGRQIPSRNREQDQKYPKYLWPRQRSKMPYRLQGTQQIWHCVEGLMDAFALWGSGMSVLVTFGSSLQEDSIAKMGWELRDQHLPIYFWQDYNMAGEQYVAALRNAFHLVRPDYPYAIVHPPYNNEGSWTAAHADASAWLQHAPRTFYQFMEDLQHNAFKIEINHSIGYGRTHTGYGYPYGSYAGTTRSSHEALVLATLGSTDEDALPASSNSAASP